MTHVVRFYTTICTHRNECRREVQRAYYRKGFQCLRISSALFCQFCHGFTLPSGMVGYVPQDLNIFMQCSNIPCESFMITEFKNFEELSRIIKANSSGLGQNFDSQGLRCLSIVQGCWQRFFGEFLAALNARLFLTTYSSPRDPT